MLPAEWIYTRQMCGLFIFILFIICCLYTRSPSSSPSRHLSDCSSTTSHSLLDTKASPLAALSLDSPGRRVSRQNLSSVKGKTHTHIYTQTHILQYTTSIRKTKPKKKNKRKRWSTGIPLTAPKPLPSNPPSHPPLSFVSKDQIKGPKETRRRRERGEAEEPKVWGAAGGKWGGEEEEEEMEK